jgi:hypothetical protein
MKEQIKSLKNETEKKEQNQKLQKIKENLKKHTDTASEGRLMLNNEINEAMSVEGEHIVMNASSSMYLPKKKSDPQIFSMGKKFEVSIFGLINHHYDEAVNYLIPQTTNSKKRFNSFSFLFFFELLLISKSKIFNSVNAGITLLNHYLFETLKKQVSEERLTLWMDNTFSTNKNQFIFNYLFLLIKYGFFGVVAINFLISGHTHIDIDRFAPLKTDSLNSNNYLNTNSLNSNNSLNINSLNSNNCLNTNSINSNNSLNTNSLNAIFTNEGISEQSKD